MTVNITTSGESGGDSLSDTVDLDEVTPGDDTDFQDVFISHDAIIAAITDCKLYVTRYAGSNYLGSDADQDYTDIMGWGDAETGGIKLSMSPPPSWTVGTEFPSGWHDIKNLYGDVNSQLPLPEEAVIIGEAANPGEIPVGGEAHIQVKVAVPASPGSAGYKAFSLVFAYSATS